MGTCFKSSIKSKSQSSSRIKLSGIMQVYVVLLLVAAASANLLKHNPNNLPVLNLNHNQVVPQVYTTLNNQVVPQVYSTQQVVPQVYTTLNKQVVPQVYTHQKQVVPQVYTQQDQQKQVVPQVYTTLNNQVVPQVYGQNLIQTPVVNQLFRHQAPIVAVQQPLMKTVQTLLTPGYIAANHGAVHTAPLPEGPSNDGFHSSHHINLPNQKLA